MQLDTNCKLSELFHAQSQRSWHTHRSIEFDFDFWLFTLIEPSLFNRNNMVAISNITLEFELDVKVEPQLQANFACMLFFMLHCTDILRANKARSETSWSNSMALVLQLESMRLPFETLVKPRAEPRANLAQLPATHNAQEKNLQSWKSRVYHLKRTWNPEPNPEQLWNRVNLSRDIIDLSRFPFTS